MYDDLIVYSFYNRRNYCILYKLGVINKGVIRLYDSCMTSLMSCGWCMDKNKYNAIQHNTSTHKTHAHRLLAIHSSWGVPAPTGTGNAMCSSKHPCFWPQFPSTRPLTLKSNSTAFKNLCITFITRRRHLINMLGQCVKHLNGPWKKIK
jgi:hypothetical protein